MRRDTWILVVIALSPAGALQPAQLQSAIYLLSKNLSAGQLNSIDFYQFEPHEYGTFTLPVHLDAEQMVHSELLEIRNDLWPAREYVITGTGKGSAQSAMQELSAGAITYAEDVVRWITSFTVHDLIHVDLDAFEPQHAKGA